MQNSKQKHDWLRRLKVLTVCGAIAVGVLTCTQQFGDIPASAKTVSQLEQEIKENNQKIAEQQQKLDDLQKNISSQKEIEDALQAQIDTINKKISLVDVQLTTINQQIANTPGEIEELEGDIAQQQIDIDQGLDSFKKRLRAMYVTGNDSLASALVGSTDFYDMLSKMDLIARVADHDDKLVKGLMEQMEQLQQSKDQLVSKQNEQELQKLEQEKIRSDYSDSIKELNEKVQQTQAAKDELQQEADAATKNIDSYKAANASKEKEQNQIIAEIKRQQELAEKQNQTQNPVVTKPDYSYTGGRFAWPVPGFYYVSSPYGPRWGGKMHHGIDIASSGSSISGAATVAVAGGTVTLVKTGCTHNYKKTSSCGCNGGYGNYVVVSHADGMSTLYAHLATVSVSYGQSVSTGTVVGTVGSTGWSTGFHLHFGVMKNGAFVNPAPYLGI